MSTLRLAQQSWGEGGTALLSRSPEFFRVKLSTAQLTLGKHCGVVLVTLLEVVSPESANCCGIRMEVGTGFLPRAPLFRTNPPAQRSVHGTSRISSDKTTRYKQWYRYI